MMALPRMRTVLQVVNYFKQEDPETTINEYFIRMMIKSGKLPAVKAGNKNLISLDLFIKILNSSENLVQEETDNRLEGYGKIRRVEL